MVVNRSLSWIGPLALGAVAMYLLDPVGGGRRRALVRDKAVWVARKTRDGAGALGRDLQHRAYGAVAEVRGYFDRSPANDRVIEERVRAQLGRVSSHPAAITVFVSDGRVTLSGPILESERDLVCRSISRVRGVEDLVDQLEVHEESGNIPALQGGSIRPGQTWLRGSWAPTTQLVAAIAGAGALAYGARTLRQ
jgi:hypothetical protein